MAFIDKLSEVAKNVGSAAADLAKQAADKTGDAVEYGKQSLRIKSAKEAIAKAEGAIGAYYHQQHKDGKPTEAGIAAQLADIDQQEQVIIQAQTTIDALKQPQPAQPQQPDQPAQPEQPTDTPDKPEC